MSNTGANTETLAIVAGRFEQIRDELQGKLTTLRGIVEGVRAEWQGSAGNSFQNVSEAWKQRQNDLIATLSSTASGIRSAGANFGSTNESARASMDKVVDLTQLGPKGGSQ